MTALTPSFFRNGDGFGILNSALCIVHCLAMPLLIAAGASFFQHPLIGWAFVILAYLAVRSAIRSRNNARTAMVLGIGWAVFAIGVVLEPMHTDLEVLTYLGSAVLIAGHVLNVLGLPRMIITGQHPQQP
ncbi:MAG: MerC domain-containing protein [Flavobacteriales bacterium]